MLGFADVSLPFEEELGIIPRLLIGEECCGCPFVDGDELRSLSHLIIVQVKFGPSLCVINHVVDLRNHLQLGGLAGVGDSPLPTGTPLALQFEEAVLDEVVDGLLMARSLNGRALLVPRLLGRIGFHKLK